MASCPVSGQTKISLWHTLANYFANIKPPRQEVKFKTVNNSLCRRQAMSSTWVLLTRRLIRTLPLFLPAPIRARGNPSLYALSFRLPLREPGGV